MAATSRASSSRVAGSPMWRTGRRIRSRHGFRSSSSSWTAVAKIVLSSVYVFSLSRGVVGFSLPIQARTVAA